MAAISDQLCNSIANDFMRGINPQIRAQNTNTQMKTIILSMKVFLEGEQIHEETRTTHFKQYSTKGEENLLDENLRKRKTEIREMVLEAPYFDTIQFIFILMIDSNVKFEENKTYTNFNYTASQEEQ